MDSSITPYRTWWAIMRLLSPNPCIQAPTNSSGHPGLYVYISQIILHPRHQHYINALSVAPPALHCNTNSRTEPYPYIFNTFVQD